MTIKKTHNIAPKKSDAKKKIEASNCSTRTLSNESQTKSDNSKQTIRKKLNEFGDNDSL
ncbi:hypothetical protein [Flavobacterium psychrophilum]|uniref:hypothetical protein n=1 Tax=Flavobacterium psychrophilum TaxID=96345 RepID=UPI0014126844|nr:hypothetical protein [Flavobacterium psychrophilum]EKT2072608.1 hypothetical protein [Flavobacterium psychrophilum]EKT4492121.1 hypothetical protein [Flavobacterium psychrophilum]